MRRFSQEEKAFIKVLINSETLKKEGMVSFHKFLYSEFFNENNKRSLLVDPETNKTYLSLDSTDKDRGRAEIVLITQLLNLMIYLEQQALITFVGDKNNSKISIGEHYPHGTTVQLMQSLSEFINAKVDNFILPSESLRVLVDDNFKTREEINHRQTLTVTWLAVIFTGVFGLWGIWKDVIASFFGVS